MSNERSRQAPSERFAPDCLVFALPAEAIALRAEPTPTRHGHRQKTLYKHAATTIALFVMDAGASLPEHTASGVVTVQAIEGELVISVSAEPRRLGPGDILIMPPGVRHDVRASSQAVFLLQVSLEVAEDQH